MAGRTEAGEPLAHPYDVDMARFSPDGRLLVTLGMDGIRLWDVAGRRTVARPLTGFTDVNDVAFSPDGRTVATVGDALQLWEVAPAKARDRPVAGTAGVAFSPDGRAVVTGGRDGTVWLYRPPVS